LTDFVAQDFFTFRGDVAGAFRAWRTVTRHYSGIRY
jgi:hypothetical protein